MKDLINVEDYDEVTESLRKAVASTKELQAENKDLKEALQKMCEYHEKNASWDKGDNGYYKAKRLLNSAQ